MQVQSLGDVFRRRKKVIPAGLSPVPQLSGGLPLIGHSVEFVRSTIELLARAQREMGEIAAFTVFNRKMVAVFGPEAHEAVFRAPDAHPVAVRGVQDHDAGVRQGHRLRRAAGEDGGAAQDAVAGAQGQAHAHVRRGRGARDREEHERAGARPASSTSSTSAACSPTSPRRRCLLGKEFREGMNEEFAAVYHDLEKGVTPLAYINAHLPIPSFRKRDKARVRMVEMITGVIARAPARSPARARTSCRRSWRRATPTGARSPRTRSPACCSPACSPGTTPRR